MGTAEPLGTAADEAAKLFDAVGEWLAHGSNSSGLGSPWASWNADHLATGSPACRLCPLCRLITAARAASPEVIAHLDDALRSLTAALRLAAEAMGNAPPSGRPATGFETIVIK